MVLLLKIYKIMQNLQKFKKIAYFLKIEITYVRYFSKQGVAQNVTSLVKHQWITEESSMLLGDKIFDFEMSN